MARRVKARVKAVDKIEDLSSRTGGLYFSNPQKGVNFIPSGCKLLDLALGGGWARGRMANIVGDKAVGKTLLAIEACANFHRILPEGIIRYRESESAFDIAYAQALGFPAGVVDFGEPVETIEDVFEDLEKVLEGARGPELYIIDSLDALSDRAELERKIDEGSFGATKAKKVSELFRRLVRKFGKTDVTLMIVSQIRDNMNAGPYAKKHVRTGGKSMDFYATHTVWLSQVEKVRRTIGGFTRTTGTWVKALVDKNKISLPYREAEFKILFGYGVDDREACLEFLKAAKVDIPKDTTIDGLHALVGSKWREIEDSFAPKEKKYGGIECRSQVDE